MRNGQFFGGKKAFLLLLLMLMTDLDMLLFISFFLSYKNLLTAYGQVERFSIFLSFLISLNKLLLIQCLLVCLCVFFKYIFTALTMILQ